jgi:hypothetical protein
MLDFLNELATPHTMAMTAVGLAIVLVVLVAVAFYVGPQQQGTLNRELEMRVTVASQYARALRTYLHGLEALTEGGLQLRNAQWPASELEDLTETQRLLMERLRNCIAEYSRSFPASVRAKNNAR